MAAQLIFVASCINFDWHYLERTVCFIWDNTKGVKKLSHPALQIFITELIWISKMIVIEFMKGLEFFVLFIEIMYNYMFLSQHRNA